MVLVKIDEGNLEGEVLESVLGEHYYSFKGIPYAAPPLGDLRFMSPQPVKPWDGTLNAKKHGPVSLQFDPYNNKILGSEDCLYLNVYSPNITPKRLLPVMVWVHEGSFSFGSGDADSHGPDFLIHHRVVLVTFNYRLKVLGFLCLQNNFIPGNAGTKDQVAAFKWVKRNINKFGGDPDNVTAFGGSSGSIALSYHLISPMSKGLFKKVILQSGVSENLWAIFKCPRARAKALAKYLGFRGGEDKLMYDFFKSVDANSLTMAPAPLKILEDYAYVTVKPLLFIIADEKINTEDTFFCMEYLKNDIHKDVEIIVGYNAHEGASVISLKSLEPTLHLFNHVDGFATKEVLDNCSDEEQIEVSDKLKHYYFGDEDVSMKNIENLIKYSTMQSFIFHIIQWVKRNSVEKGIKIFLYNFCCISERNFYAKFWGDRTNLEGNYAFHCDEIPYLFNNDIMKLSSDKESFKMIMNITILWTNFAKYGDPTPDYSLGVKWKPYTLPEQSYMRIERELQTHTKPHYDEILFWENIFKKYIYKSDKSKL